MTHTFGGAERLWERVSIGIAGTLPSRVVMAPMTTDSSNEDGSVSEEEIAFLGRRASPLLGAVITSATYVDIEGKAWCGIGAQSNEHLPSLRRVAETIHAGGTMAILQLYDAGRLADPKLFPSHKPRAPSEVASTRPGAVTPREMTDAEIRGLVGSFARAAVLASEAGFDGIELHGANHYLVQQFLSPRSNRRAKPWGGTWRDRAEFPLAVLAAIRSVVGKRFIVGYRLMPYERETDGRCITLNESVRLVETIVDFGLVDYIHVAFDNFFRGNPYLEDRLTMNYERHSMRSILGEHPIRRILDVVDGRVRTIASGGVQMPEDAVATLTTGVDAVAIGRAFVVDPDWMSKAAGKKDDEIRTRLPLKETDLDLLMIPERMRRYILSRPGWFPTDRTI